MNFLTTTEMAKVWGISSRRIALLCSQGRVEGATMKGKTWLIPENAKNRKIRVESRKRDSKCEKMKVAFKYVAGTE